MTQIACPVCGRTIYDDTDGLTMMYYDDPEIGQYHEHQPDEEEGD